jgi:hypothetical protein
VRSVSAFRWLWLSFGSARDAVVLKQSSTIERIAEDRLPCCRLSSISRTNSDIRHATLPGNLLHAIPEWVFEADAGLVITDQGRPLHPDDFIVLPSLCSLPCLMVVRGSGARRAAAHVMVDILRRATESSDPYVITVRISDGWEGFSFTRQRG